MNWKKTLPWMAAGLALVLAGGTAVWMKQGNLPLLPAAQLPVQPTGFYQNPVATKGDFADPFIMKYNGTYYLYSTTRDVKCWSSRNLTEWKAEGTVVGVGELDGTVPFAPEVVYWNGAFYMYTSPSGRGHLVLRSESPTGPFTVQTGNLGKQIDGSVFIDNDGKWYFSHAGNDGVVIGGMQDPLNMGLGGLPEANMGGWTEGPGIIFRNGRYYLTTTGNHYLSPGYRVNVSVSDKPMEGYKAQQGNPLLVSTEGGHIGLGHNMSFRGPDLVTWFTTYHNINSDRSRDLNFDQLLWNGALLTTTGPTISKQPVPGKPAFAVQFDKTADTANWKAEAGKWEVRKGFLENTEAASGKPSLMVSPFSSSDELTMEVNMMCAPGAAAPSGCIMGWKDAENYAAVLVHPDTRKLEFIRIDAGKKTLSQSADLPENTLFTALHTLRVETGHCTWKISFDTMEKLTIAEGAVSGKTGILSGGAGTRFGYTAMCEQTEDTAFFTSAKPVPGNIQAVHYATGGEGVGFHTDGKDALSRNYRNDGFRIAEEKDGSYSTALQKPGEWLAYNVNVEKDGTYLGDIRLKNLATGTRMEVWLDDARVAETTLKESKAPEDWHTLSNGDIPMKAGIHTLRLRLVKGSLALHDMDFRMKAEKTAGFSENFEKDLKQWKYIAGLGNAFTVEKGHLRAGPYGKVLAGENAWDDYTVEADIQGENNISAGILFRATQPSEGGEGEDCMLGNNFFIGYAAQITPEGVVLTRHHYDKKELATAAGSYVRGKNYHMKVVAQGSRIRVYVDDMKTPCIDYTDPEPVTHGRAGLRTVGAMTLFDNFAVTGPAKK